jgi:hypothetical protein
MNLQRHELEDQKHKTKEQDRQIQLLMDRIDSCEKNIFLQKIKIDSYELTGLFLRYFVNPIIQQLYPSMNGWSNLTGK